jgi:hypothetical protein
MIIVFYKTINIVFQNKKVIILATIVFSIAPTISNFDVCLITESLSINAVVLFLYFIISFLKKPKLYKAILMTFYVFLLIMLRPSFLFLLPILFFFWLARILLLKKEWKLNTAGIVTSLICIFLIFGYSQLNFINNQCNSISAVASVNQLGNIIDYNIYENGNDPEISETIKNNLTPTGLQTDLFDNYSYSRVTKFVIGCIINQPVIYIKKTLLKIGGLSKSTTVCIMTFYKNGFMGIPDLISNVFSISFLNLYVLMFIDLLFIIYCWIKSKQVPWFKIIVWLIIGGQFATIVIGSPAEYSGLFVVVIPCVIILLFSYIDMLLNSVDKNKLREYLTSNTTSI